MFSRKGLYINSIVGFALTSSFVSHTSSSKVYSDANSELKKVEPKLCQVQVIFRHGARTPVFATDSLNGIDFKVCQKINRPPGIGYDAPPLLKDVIFAQLHITHKLENLPRPYSSVDKFQAGCALSGGQCRLGQLTEKGAIQSAALGKELRARYKKLIPINSSTVETRSTNVGRCLATLSAVLGSFLDLNSTKRSKRAHAVVHVETLPSQHEYMTPNHSNCDILRSYFRQGHEKLAQEYSESVDSKANIMRERLKSILPLDVYEELKISKNKFVRVFDWYFFILFIV